MDFDWSVIDELVWPSCRPMMLGDRFMRNIWLLVSRMEEHESDGCNIKFEVGAFFPMADSDTDELLALGIIMLPADVAGTRGTGKEVGFLMTPVEYNFFDSQIQSGGYRNKSIDFLEESTSKAS